MAQESFDDPAIAARMNALFVNIKVDREERPDLDQIYQHALALMGEHGGWPLTMFLTPDGEPFWGGTYFPPTARWGRPGFAQVLEAIAAAYAGKRDRCREECHGVARGLAAARPAGRGRHDRPGPARRSRRAPAARGRPALWRHRHRARNFRRPRVLELFWRAWLRTGQAPYREAVVTALDAMSQGGIYDHLGGGYARYSTDARWLVPHFEKMLYDNAELVDLLTLVWQETRTRFTAGASRRPSAGSSARC